MICKSAIKGCLPSLCNNSCTWHVGQWPGVLGKWPAFAIALQQALLVLAIVPHGQLVERDFNCLKHVQTIMGIWFDFHAGWVGIPKFHQSNSIHLACWNWILFCVEHHGLIAMDVGMPWGARISRLCKFVSEVVLGAPIRNPDSKVSGYPMTFETLPFINWSTVWSTPEIISSCHETIQCLQSLETCWFMLFLVGCFISGTHNNKKTISKTIGRSSENIKHRVYSKKKCSDGKKHHARFLQTFHSFWNLWAFPGRVSGCHFHRDRGVVHGYGEKIRKHGNVTCQKLVNWWTFVQFFSMLWSAWSTAEIANLIVEPSIQRPDLSFSYVKSSWSIRNAWSKACSDFIHYMWVMPFMRWYLQFGALPKCRT